ncbi:MAG: iron transporter [Nitrospinota bacterium]
MSRRKIWWSVWAGVLAVSLTTLLMAPLRAHHLTQFTYTWMQVGKADVDGYRVTLIVKPPERSVGIKSLGEKENPEAPHRALKGFTHHFQAYVEDLRLREPVPYLDVTLSARKEEGFREDFILRPRFEERGFHYGGNVRLTRRGKYELLVILAPRHLILSEHSRRRREFFRTRQVKFEFEYGYQKLKELMKDLFGRFSNVSEQLMVLGLRAPAEASTLQSVARGAKEMNRLAALIPELRFGEAQSRFLALAKNLGEKTGGLANLLESGKADEAVWALVEVRKSCGACHQIFREGELAGR